MMDVLSSLSKEDLSFIMLKYQEDYSDEELASFLNLTILLLNQVIQNLYMFLEMIIYT